MQSVMRQPAQLRSASWSCSCFHCAQCCKMPHRSPSRSAQSSRRKGEPAGGAGRVSAPRPQATR
eukprot:3031601-Alexandrium_andersonii.AAC.1